MTDPEQPAGGEWDRGWEEHELHQLQRMAALSFAAKLEWLEEAQALVEFMNAQTQTTTPLGPKTAREGRNQERSFRDDAGETT